MIILHIGLASHFTETMNYQDEILPVYNIIDGHRVIYISDIYEFRDGKLCENSESDTILQNGLRLIRVKYDHVLFKRLSNKLLKVHKLRHLLYSIKPDSILYHGIGGYSLKYVIEYKKKHQNVLLFADCHASFDNSSKNIISKMFNKYVHGHYIKSALPYLSKILYVGDESKTYLKQMYKIPDGMLEWFPLGGTIESINKKQMIRKSIIEKYGLNDKSIIFSHSGKLNNNKKTIELLNAFRKVPDNRFTLFVIGSIDDDIAVTFRHILKEDKRIIYVGWKSGSELQEYLLASDLYCQPGTVSATLQNALCAGVPAMIYPWEGYGRFGEEFVFRVRNENEIKDVFKSISSDLIELGRYSDKAYKFAKKYLDYSVISKRIYNE